jgi:hypothetical protein
MRPFPTIFSNDHSHTTISIRHLLRPFPHEFSHSTTPIPGTTTPIQYPSYSLFKRPFSNDQSHTRFFKQPFPCGHSHITIRTRPFSYDHHYRTTIISIRRPTYGQPQRPVPYDHSLTTIHLADHLPTHQLPVTKTSHPPHLDSPHETRQFHSIPQDVCTDRQVGHKKQWTTRARKKVLVYL